MRGLCEDLSNSEELFDSVRVYGDMKNSDIYGMWYGHYSYGHLGGVWTDNLMHGKRARRDKAADQGTQQGGRNCANVVRGGGFRISRRNGGVTGILFGTGWGGGGRASVVASDGVVLIAWLPALFVRN